MSSTFEDAAQDLRQAWDERSKRRANGQWPDPHPLPDSLLPVASFDFDLLPERVRPWAADICERMQCPPDFVGVSAMAALGTWSVARLPFGLRARMTGRRFQTNGRY
jgi:putative DNA primase/helicase